MAACRHGVAACHSGGNPETPDTGFPDAEDRDMSISVRFRQTRIAVLLAASAMALSAAALAQSVEVELSGAEEVPPVETEARGQGTITVGDDKTVSGEVETTGVQGTMAHIHEGAKGANGGIAVPLEDAGDGKWKVPAGAKLTDAQYEAFKAGKLYVNVHSAQHKGGELRGQLEP